MTEEFFVNVHEGLHNPKQTKRRLEPLFKLATDPETDPLSCALLGAAFIDRFLLDMLREVFAKGQTAKDLLKSDSGLVGSLYNRARVAYVLGLIDSTWLTNIRLIGEIRNHFAHSPEPLTFSSPAIVKLCEQLESPKGYRPGVFFIYSVDMFATERMSDPRSRFVTIALQIATSLMFQLHKLDDWKALTSRKGKSPKA